MSAITCLLACVILLLCFFIWVKLRRLINRKRLENEPPMVPGHPIFGNGADFEKDAVQFLLQSAKRFGDIFTLRFLHHHITIVMDIHAYQDFCRNEAFDFDVIQKQVNWNVFHFVIRNTSTIIRESAKTVRGKQLVRTMSMFCEHLNRAIAEKTASATEVNHDVTAEAREWKVDSLRTVLGDLMFSSIFYTLFGKQDKAAAFNPKTVNMALNGFHRYFNYLWLGLPIQLLPEAHRLFKLMMSVSPSASELLSKDDALPYIRTSTKCMLEAGQTDEEVRKHNLVLLHVNYNTYRVAFWALYNLLVDKEAREAVQNEAHELLTAKVRDGKVELTLDDLASLPLLDSFVKETFRLASGVFMIRGVTQNAWFGGSSGQKYQVRKGDKIAIYPPAIHHDPELFPRPDKFVYDRFVNAVFRKNGREVKNPLLPFGSLCPGQSLAINQLKLFLVAWCCQIDAQLLPGERTAYNKKCYGHEILPPENDVQIRFRRVAQFDFVVL